MKKLILLFMLAALVSIGYAQKVVIPSSGSKVVTPPSSIDSSKAKHTHKSKLQYANGTTMVSTNDVIANLSHAADFQVFYNAIKMADMTETLKSRGPFTVFAPNDDAFKKLAAGKLDTLLKPANKIQLSNLVSSHIVAGKLTVKDISKQINSGDGHATLITLAGNKLIAKIDGNRNIVLIDDNGNQSVINVFDLQQSNGVIHVVNSVLTPKNKAI